MTILVTLLRQNRPLFFFKYAAFLVHSCLISPPRWLIDMLKCPNDSTDAGVMEKTT